MKAVERSRPRLTARFFVVSSLLVTVLVPTLVCFVYLLAVASPRYDTEMRFVVRGATEKLRSSSGAFGSTYGALMGMNGSQEANILVNYIRSAGILSSLQERGRIRQIYSRPDIDWWSRLDPDASDEELLDYWLTMVKTDIEAISGIVTVRISAFSPDDSLQLADTVRQITEDLVNGMADRVRDDTLARSDRELERASIEAAKERQALLTLRNEAGQIDASQSAQSLLETLSKIRQDRIVAETELKTSLRTLSENSPSVRELRDKLRGINTQIRNIEQQLTGDADKKDGTASAAISTFDRLQAEISFAEQTVMIAADALSQARTDIRASHAYVETFVPPSLPQQSTSPSAVFRSATVLGKTFVVWTIVTMLGLAIREHVT